MRFVVRVDHLAKPIVARHGFGANSLELGIVAQPHPDRIQIKRRIRTETAVHGALHEAKRVLRTAAIGQHWRNGVGRFGISISLPLPYKRGDGIVYAAPRTPSRHGCMSRRVESSAACRVTCRAASRSLRRN